MSTYTKPKVSSVSMVHSLREVTAWTLGELAFLIQQVYDACSAVLNQICDEEDTKENHFFDTFDNKSPTYTQYLNVKYKNTSTTWCAH